MKIAQPGTPGRGAHRYAPMPEQPEYGTSHISIVDGYGNAMAMTTTIEDQFGSRQMVRGFLLNNELTDFSFAPADAQGRPDRQPRAARQAAALLDGADAGVRQGAPAQLVMSGGSPGGALIIHFTAKTLYGVLNWGMTPQQAIDLPNFALHQRAQPAGGEALPAGHRGGAAARGAEVREQAMTSGLQAITAGTPRQRSSSAAPTRAAKAS